MDPRVAEIDEYDWIEPEPVVQEAKSNLKPLTELEESQSTDPRIQETKDRKSFASRHSSWKQTGSQLSSSKRSSTTYYALLEDLRHNDVKGFRSTLESQGLPRDSKWYDYDLLTRALRLNRKRIVIHLLEKNCRVNKPWYLSADANNTPLHLAAEKSSGWCDVIDRMLKLGARVTDVNAKGNTPLHLAFLNDLSDAVVRKLLDHYLDESTEDIYNKEGLGFMHIACTRAKPKAVQQFFDLGMCDIFTEVPADSESIYAGYSPLHFAVAAGKHEVVKFLCEYGADVYAQDRNKSTPLHLALEKKDSRMIQILFEYDSKNLNTVNNFGVSHFMAACAAAVPQVVEEYLLIAEQDPKSSARKLLIDRVQDIPHYPIAGYTPLHFACELGNFEVVHEFLKIGAGQLFLAQTSHGLTPYELAIGQQREDVGQLIKQFYYAYPHMFVQQEQQQQQQQQQQEQQYCSQEVYVSEPYLAHAQTLQTACH